MRRRAGRKATAKLDSDVGTRETRALDQRRGPARILPSRDDCVGRWL